MKMKTQLTTFLVLICMVEVVANAQSISIKGLVVDRSLAPIGNVEILALCNQQRCSTVGKTGPNGEYIIVMDKAQDSFDLSFFEMNYHIVTINNLFGRKDHLINVVMRSHGERQSLLDQSIELRNFDLLKSLKGFAPEANVERLARYREALSHLELDSTLAKRQSEILADLKNDGTERKVLHESGDMRPDTPAKGAGAYWNLSEPPL